MLLALARDRKLCVSLAVPAFSHTRKGSRGKAGQCLNMPSTSHEVGPVNSRECYMYVVGSCSGSQALCLLGLPVRSVSLLPCKCRQGHRDLQVSVGALAMPSGQTLPRFSWFRWLCAEVTIPAYSYTRKGSRGNASRFLNLPSTSHEAGPVHP